MFKKSVIRRFSDDGERITKRKFEGLQPLDYANLTEEGTLLRGCLGGIEDDYGKTT